MHTPPPAAPAAQPAAPVSPPETVSLEDLNAAAAARERDDAAWCTHALLQRPPHPDPPARAAL